MAHAQSPTKPSPKPSPDGPTSRDLLFEPPPVKKPAARRLHELQDPASPVKARKLFRTESGIELPPIDLGESVLAVPVNLNGMSFLADAKDTHENANQDSKDKAPTDLDQKDPSSTSPDVSPDPRNCPLMLSSRKKRKPELFCLADILNPKPAKSDKDLATTEDPKEPPEFVHDYGLFADIE
jgi:hypothetical protein